MCKMFMKLLLVAHFINFFGIIYKAISVITLSFNFGDAGRGINYVPKMLIKLPSVANFIKNFCHNF